MKRVEETDAKFLISSNLLHRLLARLMPTKFVVVSRSAQWPQTMHQKAPGHVRYAKAVMESQEGVDSWAFSLLHVTDLSKMPHGVLDHWQKLEQVSYSSSLFLVKFCPICNNDNSGLPSDFRPDFSHIEKITKLSDCCPVFREIWISLSDPAPVMRLSGGLLLLP